jgi:DNA excision repair protein ERCC-2
LQAVLQGFRELCPDALTVAQSAHMTEAAREEFLAGFRSDHIHTLVGFAVLGGIFGEGIDLVGDRLVGAVVVGVGLPQICLERDLIRSYYDNDEAGSGFYFAYTFPGVNKVLQAVGRVIRSDTDRGIALLIDTRFRQLPYRDLLPTHWNPVFVGDSTDVAVEAKRFWSSQSV